MIFLSDKSQRVNLKIDAELQECLTSLSNKMKVTLDEVVNAGLATVRRQQWIDIIQNYKLEKLTAGEMENASYLPLAQTEKELMLEKRQIDDEIIQTLCSHK